MPRDQAYVGPPLSSVIRDGRVRGLLDLVVEARSRASVAGVTLGEMLREMRAEEHASSYPRCRLQPDRQPHDH